MKKRGILKLFLAMTAIFVAFFGGCNLENKRSQSEASSAEQSEIPEEQPCEHVFGEWMPYEEPNCEYDGFKMRICTVCGEEDELILPALGHTPDEYLRYEPTCLRGGSVSQSCTRCGEILYFETLPKLTTHEPTITSVDRKPTCTVSGYEQKHCACGEFVIDTFSPCLGGHIDGNADLLCDTCEEKLYSIPVYLSLRGNATATAADHVFIGEQSGGIVSVTMGENSIFYQSYTAYSALPDDPDFVSGNVAYSRPRTIMPWELNSLTTTYHHHITADNITFGKPQEITIEIADTTQTGLVILEQFSIPSEENQKNFTQLFLFWGELSTEITVTGTDNEYLAVGYYTDTNGTILSNEKTVNVVLTESITYLRVYYQSLKNAE